MADVLHTLNSYKFYDNYNGIFIPIIQKFIETQNNINLLKLTKALIKQQNRDWNLGLCGFQSSLSIPLLPLFYCLEMM